MYGSSTLVLFYKSFPTTYSLRISDVSMTPRDLKSHSVPETLPWPSKRRAEGSSRSAPNFSYPRARCAASGSTLPALGRRSSLVATAYRWIDQQLAEEAVDEGRSRGIHLSEGDIAYYAPWETLRSSGRTSGICADLGAQPGRFT